MALRWTSSAKVRRSGKDVDDLGGVGGKLGLVDGGGQFGRRRQVERQRDVLGEVETAVVQGVLADVAAESVAAGAGGGGGGEFGVDLVANLLADGGGVGEIGIVAAGVERDGNIEQGFAGLERDGGAAGLRLSDAGRSLCRDVWCMRLSGCTAAARRAWLLGVGWERARC